MHKTFLLIAALLTCAPLTQAHEHPTTDIPPGYQLVWADEFDQPGRPNPDNWNYEQGFVRNRELQWYQPQNAVVRNGHLVIEARRTNQPNPRYVEDHRDWRRNRKSITYTSASLKTRGKHNWTYGIFEMRAKIKAEPGLWPAYWTIGDGPQGWPHCGEIDIMEFYRGTVLANVAWGGQRRYQPIWDATRTPVTEFNDANWDKRFHTWRMEWTPDHIKLFLDGQLMNTTRLTDTVNRDEQQRNPFHDPHHIIINLAIGGDNGGDPSDTHFPSRYLIDYVRVYQHPDISPQQKEPATQTEPRVRD